MSDRQRVRVIVVGAGLISQAMRLPHLALLDERFETVALVDPSRTVRERLAARFAIPATFGSHEGALDAVQADAMLVASPSVTHARITCDALARGLHVFVEKPFRPRVRAARRRAALKRRPPALRQRGRPRPRVRPVLSRW